LVDRAVAIPLNLGKVLWVQIRREQILDSFYRVEASTVLDLDADCIIDEGRTSSAQGVSVAVVIRVTDDRTVLPDHVLLDLELAGADRVTGEVGAEFLDGRRRNDRESGHLVHEGGVGLAEYDLGGVLVDDLRLLVRPQGPGGGLGLG